MKRFDSEAARNEFKGLCTEVLPAIGNIEQILKKQGVTDGATIRIGSEGYLSLDISNSKWRMARYEQDKLPKIIYEHSEEISVPDSRQLDRVSENLVEISLAFADMQITHSELSRIESMEWKQKFVEYSSYMFGECNTYIDEPIPKTLFYEPYSDRFFESTIVDVMQAEYRNICQN